MAKVKQILIKNGLVYDGSGAEGQKTDILVEGDVISEIGPDLEAPKGTQVVDVSGRAVSPGFIDIHSHGDLEPLCVPNADSKLSNGVTTEVVGNCGSSPFPILDHFPGYLREKSEFLGVEVDWKDAGGYLDALEKKPCAINRLTLVGHGRVRAAVMGQTGRAATIEEIERMAELVGKSVRQGCWGVSTGLAYSPGVNAERKELVAIAKAAAKEGGYYATHQRNEGGGIIDSLCEAEEICKEAGARLQVSHIKISGQENWGKLNEVKEFLLRLSEHLPGFGCDWYPYEAWNANLDALLPGWVYEGGTAKLLSRLKDPDLQKQLARHVVKESRNGISWDKVVIGSVTLEDHERFQGCSIAEIAEELGLTPEDAYFHLILAEGGRAEGIVSTMDMKVQAELLQLPFVSVGSDSTARPFKGPVSHGHHHPRTYGTAARFLRRVREEKILPMGEAIRRMSSLPASQIGLKNRGLLRKGYAADVVVFNAENITDVADYRNPKKRSKGVEHVMVNGVFALRSKRIAKKFPGTVLRKGNI